ncbi:monodechloroaminopyrrolnitrin synthase PrnB family protein [Phytomonospora sp. NPDC050363]|uniref:monodechloroaminopyrrolnitrin synthase PrnB family protein n=1 Tax=Phytomonospora sp. NPDC050363 TaxID=3155642 RepID=UPI0033F60F7C
MPHTPIEAYDAWLRGRFAEANTLLEEAYFAERAEILGGPRLDKVKQEILLEGVSLIDRISDLPTATADRYRLLGLVGFHLAACRRHETGDASTLAPAWTLARLLGSTLGVAPRFVFSHQSLYNTAVDGEFITFTTLPDEAAFIRYNTLGVLAYQRAAEALRPIASMGVSNPSAAYLFDSAAAALGDVLAFNRALAEDLDTERFFYNIRPYFKPHRVGGMEFRGVNAGDFSGVNEIDLLLGLVGPRDPFYLHLMAEKDAYLPPGDAEATRRAIALADGPGSLLTRLLAEVGDGPATGSLKANAEAFLAVCRAHGAAYTFHHHRLVLPFLVAPATQAPPERMSTMSASGPPLDVVVAHLSHLSDLRAARDRPGTAKARLDRLRELVG